MFWDVFVLILWPSFGNWIEFYKIRRSLFCWLLYGKLRQLHPNIWHLCLFPSSTLQWFGSHRSKSASRGTCSMEPCAGVSFHADSRKGLPSCTQVFAHKQNNQWTRLILLAALLIVLSYFWSPFPYFPPPPSSRLKYLILLFSEKPVSPSDAEISLLIWATKMLSSTGLGKSGGIGWSTHTEIGNRTSTDFIGSSIKSTGQL